MKYALVALTLLSSSCLFPIVAKISPPSEPSSPSARSEDSWPGEGTFAEATSERAKPEVPIRGRGSSAFRRKKCRQNYEKNRREAAHYSRRRRTDSRP